MVELTIDTDTDAFSEAPGIEIARVLRKVADEIENGCTLGRIADVNGNAIGLYEVTDD